MPHFGAERRNNQFAWLKGRLFSVPKPRKEVKGPSVPCGVSLVTFFPLVERKLPCGAKDTVFDPETTVSVSAKDNPSGI